MILSNWVLLIRLGKTKVFCVFVLQHVIIVHLEFIGVKANTLDVGRCLDFFNEMNYCHVFGNVDEVQHFAGKLKPTSS